MVYSIIQKFQLEGAHRLDAEYYQPEYLETKRVLLAAPHLRLGDCAFVTDGEHGSVDFANSGIKYLTAENITEGFLRLEDIRYVNALIDKRNKRASLVKEDVVLSIKGSVGLAALISQENLPANMNRDVSRIHIKKYINPYFLTVFLNSEFGKRQTLRESSGNVQQMITLSRIRELLIPRINQQSADNIKKLFLASYEKLNESKKLSSSAENLLLKELELEDFQSEEDLSFTINLSDIQSAHRTDAEFFQPKYDRILKALSRHQIEKLSKNFTIIKSKSFQYNDIGKIGVIQTKQLGKQFINCKTETATDEKIIKEEMLPLVTDSDVLFASMGVGSLGKTNMFYSFESEDKKYTIDSTLRIFRQKESSNLLPEVLTVFLSSRIGQELIYKYIIGTSGIISIYGVYLENFLIPVLPKLIQQRIANLVKKSHEARKKSKELLEEAKRKVEEMIEKGSD